MQYWNQYNKQLWGFAICYKAISGLFDIYVYNIIIIIIITAFTFTWI